MAGWRYGWKWWLTLVAVTGGVIYLIENSPAPTPAPPRVAGEGDPAPSARAMCREMVLRVLDDPSSAEFLPRDEWRVEALADHVWRIDAPLRAKNRLGATILTSFRCEVRDEGENWRGMTVTEWP